MNIPSRIKDVFIELPHYSFRQEPTPGSPSGNDLFIGRINVRERLKMLLSQSALGTSGAYLITGYRGMGKTTLVNYVIEEINKNKETIEEFPYNSDHQTIFKRLKKLDVALSQDNLKDQDVLRLMARQLYRSWQDISREVDHYRSRIDADCLAEQRDIMIQLRLLIENVDHATNTASSDKGNSQTYHDRTDKYAKILTRLAYQPKEIERELIFILDRINSQRIKLASEFKVKEEGPIQVIPDFVFIVDELDKIEPHYLYERSKHADDDDVFGMNKIRRRQEEIERLLASLKNFLNIARAKFIFIGGREMYDAGLADISDRESFFSSIFHDIIYVPSFFKDKLTNQSGLTKLTETYLCKLIIPPKKEAQQSPLEKESDEDIFDLKEVFKHLTSLKNPSNVDEMRDAYKTIFLLQNFILYLTYRSNGTPKKLVSLIEGYIVLKDNKDIAEIEKDNKDIVFRAITCSKGKSLFLKFNYNQQYEIGLTSNLYRPYAIIHSRTLKSLGDKLLYSTAYIMDYLLKFHPHAFSWRNLEMIPEIILVNRDPNLRYYLEDVLKFLTGLYIRNTVNSIFHYKFYARAASEIKLLSKISEPASAAFNFTLDESLQVKSYYRKKLKQLQNTHPEHKDTFVHSISFIQSILADLHYFDKEYDEAIIYHADAIQVLRPKVQNEPQTLTKHQAVLYVRHKLLLSLCLEKVKAFDSAYSTHRGLILNLPNLLDQITGVEFESDGVEARIPDWDKPLRRMQLFIRPHIALLDIIEKQRTDGITYANLSRNFADAFRFLVDNKKPDGIGYQIDNAEFPKKDSVRVHTLISDYYNHVGMLLFYKNRNFRELYSLLSKLGYNIPNLGVEEFLKDIKQNSIGEVQNEKHSTKPNQDSSDKEPENPLAPHYTPSFSSLIYYLLALREIMLPLYNEVDQFISAEDLSNENDFSRAIILLYPAAEGIANASALFTIGNIISKIGDALLSSMPDNKTNGHRFKMSEPTLLLFGDNGGNNELFSHVGTKVLKVLRENANSKKNINDFLCLDFIAYLYRVASYFFLKAGRNSSCAFQYKKFLYILKDCISFSWQDQDQSVKEKEEMFTICAERVAERIFFINTSISEVSNRPQILKYRDVFEAHYQSYPKEESVPSHIDRETKIIYKNISTSPDVREVVALVEEIRYKIYDKLNQRKKVPNIVSPYDQISSKFARFNELRAQSTLNFIKLKDTDFSWLTQQLISEPDWGIDIQGIRSDLEEAILKANAHKSDNTPNDELDQVITSIAIKFKDAKSGIKLSSTQLQRIKDVIKVRLKEYIHKYYKYDVSLKDSMLFAEFYFDTSEENLREKDIELLKVKEIICDSIFCLFEIAKTLNLFGISHIFNYSYLANTHFKIAKWCQAYVNYQKLIDGNIQKIDSYDGIKSSVERLIGKEDALFLEPNYHNELAIQYYYAAIQTHNGGKHYKQINQSMSFLEDDYNDELTHFCTATERFRINIGFIRGKIKELKDKIATSKIYDYRNYIPDDE